MRWAKGGIFALILGLLLLGGGPDLGAQPKKGRQDAQIMAIKSGFLSERMNLEIGRAHV